MSEGKSLLSRAKEVPHEEAELEQEVQVAQEVQEPQPAKEVSISQVREPETTLTAPAPQEELTDEEKERATFAQLREIYSGAGTMTRTTSDMKILSSIKLLLGMASMTDTIILLPKWEVTSQGMTIIVEDEDLSKSDDFLYYVVPGFVMGDPSSWRNRETKERFFHDMVHFKAISDPTVLLDIESYEYAWFPEEGLKERV